MVLSTRQQHMLAAWAAHEGERRSLAPNNGTNMLSHDPNMHSTIGVQPGTRLYRIIRITDAWRLWLATRDFIHGTYMDLYGDGTAIRTECRPDEGDEVYRIRPSDEEIINRGVAEPRPQLSTQSEDEGTTNETP